MKKLIVAVAMICCMAECMARDVSRISGTDIVVGNAKKESGYSNAQLQVLAKALNGRELTFENGKITSVSKSPIDGGVKAMFSFQAPGAGRFSRSLTVNATFSDAEMAKLVEKLDEGTKVKTLKGRVHYDGGFFVFFELKDATVEVDGPAPGESAIDPEKMTGAYIVAENARKESGYSSAQLQALAKALNGRELTFENGKITSVSRNSIDGGVKAMMSFKAPGAGRFSRSLTVNATFSDAEMAKLVERLDEGTKVKTLKGRVHYEGGFFVFFELKDATVEVDGPAPGESAIDPEKVTGAYIVAENARKESGYSSAQLQEIAKALNGRELTFENGKITSVSRSPIDGGVKAMMSFKAPGAGRFSRSLTVNATFSDAEMAKLVEKLDEGTKVKTLKGRVHYEGGFFVFFELKDATVEVDGPAPGESAIDPEKVTGAYIVAENARKESGYSSAQLQALAKALNGRELTFENGKITSVNKDEDDGSVTAMVSFEAPGAGMFHPDFTVQATFTDPAMARFVERLDAGTKVRQLKGRVHYDGDFFTFFELKDATVEVE